MRLTRIGHSGFTLIELIIALVIAAIVAAGVASFLGPSLTQSGRPLERLQRSGQLRSIMENITNDYNRFTGIKNHATLVTLQNSINTCGTVGSVYKSGLPVSVDCFVLQNGFVTFNGSNQEIADNPSTGRTLKVTIRLNPGSAETLTTFFTAD